LWFCFYFQAIWHWLDVFPGLQLELTAVEHAGAAAMEEEQNSWMKIINKKAYSYRKDDRAMRPMHWCPENVWDSDCAQNF